MEENKKRKFVVHDPEKAIDQEYSILIIDAEGREIHEMKFTGGELLRPDILNVVLFRVSSCFKEHGATDLKIERSNEEYA